MCFMKVFLIIPTLNQGGAERVMAELANQFIQYDNVEIHLVLLAKAEIFYHIDSRIIVHQLGFENKGSFQKKISELRTFRKLRALLRQHRPDSVLSFMDKYNVFTLLASAFTGTKVFVSERSNPHKKRTGQMQLLRKYIYPYANGIIAQTELAKAKLFSLTNHKNIKVIPNPDRKSTRLNSSHVASSYAVFCLKKKNLTIYHKLVLPRSLQICSSKKAFLSFA